MATLIAENTAAIKMQHNSKNTSFNQSNCNFRKKNQPDIVENRIIPANRIYQDAIFDTKKKALPGVELPKRAKNKDFQQILGLLEVLFRYAIVWQVVTEVTGHAAY